jgi:hypothetical protein
MWEYLEDLVVVVVVPRRVQQQQQAHLWRVPPG